MSGARIARLEEPLDDGRFLCVFLLLGADGWVLVDTGLAGTPERTIGPALAAHGRGWDELRAVVVTHADVDHSGGLGAVRRLAPQATVIAGAADRELIESVDALLDRRYREFRHDHGIDQDDAFVAWVRANADDGTVDVALDGDALLRVGDGAVVRDDAATVGRGDGWTVRLLTAPGHTAGHLIVHDPASGTVIAADAVLGSALPGAGGRPAFAPTYRFLPAYRETIARVQALEPDLLLCSHLPPLAGEEARAFLRESAAFVARAERAVLDALDEAAHAAGAARGLAGAAPSAPGADADAAPGLTLADLIAAVAADRALATWPRAADGTLAQPLAGHLEELREQGLVRRLAGHPARHARTRAAQTR